MLSQDSRFGPALAAAAAALAVDRAPFSVLVGADSLTARRAGIGRMTIEIVRAAQQAQSIRRVDLLFQNELAEGSAIDHLTDDGIAAAAPPTPRPVRIAIGRLPGVQALRRLKHGGLGRKLRRLSREAGGRLVYHEPNMIVQPIGLPTVTTINDLSWLHYPAWHPAERLRWIEQNLQRSLQQARRLVAISEFTKGGVMRDLGIGADRVDVVPLAPAPCFRPMTQQDSAETLARYGLEDRRFVLSISTIEPRKNFDRLLAAYLLLPPSLRSRVPLVIAGGKGWGDSLTRPGAQQALRAGTLRMLGHVPDADLPVLCARAGVFAYVSLYEGFGLPVVEAMAAGTAVLASETTAVGEIASGAATLVNPFDTGLMAEGLQAMIEDAALAERLRSAGLVRAAQYSWASTLAGLEQTWRRAL